MDTQTIDRDVKELRRTVYGNGTPGLKTRMDCVETRMDTGVKILWSLLILAVPSSISVVGIAAAILMNFS